MENGVQQDASAEQNKFFNEETTMQMIIDFPGGAQVDAHFGPYTVQTDQPPAGGGEGSAPTPFALFLAFLGTCAGIYILGFCKQRGLPAEGIRLVQHVQNDPATGLPEKIFLEIQVPPTFPEKYLPSLIRSAELCKVKKTIEAQPVFEVTTAVAAADGMPAPV